MDFRGGKGGKEKDRENREEGKGKERGYPNGLSSPMKKRARAASAKWKYSATSD